MYISEAIRDRVKTDNSLGSSKILHYQNQNTIITVVN